jgi:hypothetical protein
MKNKRGKIEPKDALEDLYLNFLNCFYGKQDHPASRKLAAQVEAELARRADLSESIRGDELRSLLFELRGNLASAIQSRQSEIRRILELHSVAWGTPGWNYVFKQYDYGDIADRLDLLATLHAQAGDHREAVRILEESRSFCASHGIPFDGEDLLKDYAEAASEEVSSERDLDNAMLDPTIIEVYRDFNRSAEQIVVDDQMSRRLLEEVNRRLPSNMRVSSKLVKSRLLSLRKKGEERGGLPRLRHPA